MNIIKDLNEETRINIVDISKNRNDIIILDMSYHLFRYYNVFKHLSIVDGNKRIPTGHIYGFLKLLGDLKRYFDRPAIIIAVDGYDEERKQINKNYKANRVEKEFNVHDDTDVILEMSSLMSNVYVARHPKYEADDTIYSVAKVFDYLCKKNNIDKNIYIYSSDKDLYQAVNDKIKIISKINKTTRQIIGIEEVKEKFHNVDPNHLVYFRALVGDTSDNLKGYNRIPKKVAARLAYICDFTEEKVIPREDISETEQRWVNKINEDYNLFKNNYAIMKAKEYPFVIEKPYSNRAWDLVNYYKLNSYKKALAEVGRR